jgi:6-pyruvoyltetrahydropterin/6-carboxytetrahydropterin synthase
MFEITTESTFSAAHQLRNYSGPCENLHGHNWLVKATVRTDKLDKSGIGIDFKILKKNLSDILGVFDHKDLNVIFDKLEMNPSSENIAQYIFEKLKATLPKETVTVTRIDVFETPGNCASYFE